MKRGLLIGFALLVAMAKASAQQYDNAPSTNWWMAEPFRHNGNIVVPNIGAEVRGANYDIPVITKVIGGAQYHYADWIDDGDVGIPVAGDNVVVAIHGHAGPDVVFLYGIEANRRVVVAFPIREYAQGRRTARYAGNNRVVVFNPDNIADARMYCWSGTDWFQGLNATSCDMTHHARLINLCGPGQGLVELRSDYYGAATRHRKRGRSW